MADPQRPHHPASTTPHKSNTGLYVGITAVVVLLLALFFGGFFADDPVADQDVTTPATTQGEDVNVITTDPATDTGTAPADPATGDDTITIEGDAEVEVLDES